MILSAWIKKISQIIDITLEPVVLSIIAAVLIILAFTTKIPSADSLVERSGYLSSYYFKENVTFKFGNYSYIPIITLKNGNRFWTKAFDQDRDIANKALKKDVLLRYYIDPNSKNEPIGTIVKGYGLWINGQQVQSVNDVTKNERFRVRALLLYAIIVLIRAIFVYRRNLTRSRSKYK